MGIKSAKLVQNQEIKKEKYSCACEEHNIISGELVFSEPRIVFLALWVLLMGGGVPIIGKMVIKLEKKNFVILIASF